MNEYALIGIANCFIFLFALGTLFSDYFLLVGLPIMTISGCCIAVLFTLACENNEKVLEK